jgi:S-methylmethionine-dependent homocysteine/selenocysteine methylase
VPGPAPPSLAGALGERVVVLDGGLATQLEAEGADLAGDHLWSARLLRDDPDAVVAAHRAFFAAGAEVATTASYQASVPGFVRAGLAAAEAERLLARSVELAAAGRAELPDDRPRWVAASVGPYGAVLADGSEYRGDYGLSVTQLREFHRRRLAVLAGAGPDVLACETVPCLAEAEALLAEIDALGFPAWLSLSARGDRTAAGEPLATAFRMARDVPAVVAAGVNCCRPAEVPAAVRAAARESGLPVVAYPNSGERWDPVARRWTGPCGLAPDDAAAWVAAGARLVGGCCRVGPDDIAALAGRLRGVR